MIKLFGLTAFGITAQSSLICSAVMGVVFLIGRTIGLTRPKALWATVAIFGLLMVDRRLLQVRMENLTALSGLVGLHCLLQLARSESPSKQRLYGQAAGLIFTTGLYSIIRNLRSFSSLWSARSGSWRGPRKCKLVHRS